ncbi:MAG TPA: phosphoribosylformylglycinamidine cyclo-ligase, partial [Clostridiaceae bacterium]|nr:phosphoribosylformylglycinamidine cyclo-ligase [Clostridiaceae bacterium]
MIDYKSSGVNIEEGYRAVELMKEHTKKTMIPGVINGIGSFAGMFELPDLKNPVLVSGT